MRLIELERRGGATPLAECRELSDAFRSKVGVPEREGVTFGEGWPFKGLRRAWLGRGEVRFSVELRRRGDLAGDEVERERCFKDWARSLSLFAVGPFGGEGEGGRDGAIAKAGSHLRMRNFGGIASFRRASLRRI